MRTLFLSLLVFGLALTASAAPPDLPPKPTDPKVNPVVPNPPPPGQLDGAYSIVSGERNGTAIPEAEIKDGVVRFADREVIGRDKNSTAFLGMTYTLDTKQTPWKISMKEIVPEELVATAGPPKTTTGLVKKDGMMVTIIYALPGGEAPTEFKTKDKQQMFVLKNYAAAPKVEDSKFERP